MIKNVISVAPNKSFRLGFIFSVCFFLLVNTLRAQSDERVYLTSGFRIGEVTDQSAIIHTRVCLNDKPVPVYHKKNDKNKPIDFDEKMPIEEMDGAVTGAKGQVKIKLISKFGLVESEWEETLPENDFTIKRSFEGLSPGTEYEVIVMARKESNGPVSEERGRFSTAPSIKSRDEVSFTVSTCQYFWTHDDSLMGFKVYQSMLDKNPDFHCHTGDYVYYDRPGPKGNKVETARHKWHAMNSWPSVRAFFDNTPVYFQKDDHDLLKDDATKYSSPYGKLTYDDGLKIWYEQVPIIDKPYRTVRWGKNLQIWLVEGREYRSDNKDPDSPEKSILGKEQIDWLKETLETSDATFKLLVSATPIVGPDRLKGKFDNHSNAAFKTEGDWLRQYLADQGVMVLNGDRHWQYVSKDLKTGLMEFSCGPVSDAHAQGWKQSDVKPEHQFLRVKGGFLRVVVSASSKKKATIELIHYDVNGKEVNKVSYTKKVGK